ncbi:MAG: hypothetical protein IKK85_03545 [Clostridia bacterium]|nr:hypothetical protein [Clostridia bacterium]
MANDGFGLYPKIKLDGEADFKKAIASVNKDLNVLSSEMKLSTATFGDNNESMTALTAKAGILNEQMEQQTKKVETLREAVQTMKDTYGENSDKVKEWQFKLNNAETQLLKTKDAIEKNQEAIEELGKKEKAIDKIKDGFTDLKDKVGKAHDKLEPTRDKLKKVASVSFKGLAAGVTGATAAVTALNAGAIKAAQTVFELAETTAETGKEILVMSERTGLSTKAYQEWDYIAKQAGTTMDTLQGGITDLAEKMDDAAKGEGEAAEIFAKLGVKVTDSTGKLKNQEKVFEETITALQGVRNETERQALATKLMSTTGEELLPLLNGEIGSIKELKEAVSEYGLIMSDEAINASVNFSNSLDTLKSTSTAFKDNLVNELLPGATETMDGITMLITGKEGASEKINDGIDSMMGKLNTIIPTILSKVDEAVEPIGEGAVKLIGSLADGLLNNSDKIANTAGNLIKTLSGTLVNEENLDKLINSGVDLVVELGGGLLKQSPTIIDAAFTLIDKLLDALEDDENMDALSEAAVDIVLQLGSGLIGSTPQLIKVALELIGCLVRELKNYDWRALGSKIWSNIKEGLFGDAESEGVDGSHAVGLSYVPYDNYIAELHKGERILTAAENEAFSVSRQASSNSLTREDVAALRSDLQAIANILSGGIGVDINNTRDLGRAVKQSA